MTTIYINTGPASGVYMGRPFSFPAWTGNLTKLMAVIRDALSPFTCTVTISKPTDPNAVECIIGSSFGGYPGGGAADMGNSPVFVFAEYFVDETHLAYECLHEIGHAFNLDHQAVFQNGVCVNPYRPGCYLGQPHSSVPLLG